MWGRKERTSLALRRMNNPAQPHKLKGLVGLGRIAKEIIRSTSICNPNASDTKLDEAKPNPKSTEEEVGSQESEKEVIDLGHRKGNKDREKIALQMGLIAAKQHSHKLVEALQAQAGQPDADGNGRKTGPLYAQRSAATEELMEKELPALETLLSLQGIDHPAMMLMEESGMYTDVIVLHEKVKALANKEMVALKRVKDGKPGPTIWVDPQRVREREPEKVGTIEKDPAALELLV